MARASHVFNVEQVDGWEIPRRKRLCEVEANEQIEAFVRATKADVRHGSSRACYRRQGDYIDMPGPEKFIGTPTSSPTEAYYAVKLHELIHNAEPSIMPRRSGFARKTRPDRRCHAA